MDNSLIKRQAAIDALGEQPTGWSCGEYEEGLISQWKSDVEAIKQLPSAEPQERKGKWIRVDNLHMRCNHCDVIHLIAQYPRGNIDYCPNCGFKMEVEHETD